MTENRYIYEGEPFSMADIEPVCYQSDFFEQEIALESDVFFELRRLNDIQPYRLDQSSEQELAEIRRFFEEHYTSFFFLIEGSELIGSILLIRNYIQSLAIARKFQRQGYGRRLTMYAVNYLLNKGFRCVEVNILPGNRAAHFLYTRLGFRLIE